MSTTGQAKKEVPFDSFNPNAQAATISFLLILVWAAVTNSAALQIRKLSRC